MRCGPCMGPWLGGSCVGDREATDASHAWGAHPSGGYIMYYILDTLCMIYEVYAGYHMALGAVTADTAVQ